MDFKDYYKILGVEPSADDKEIKAAYRKLARKYHPDVSKEKDAEEKFKDASEAYEALKSADKRAEYDELRKYGQHGQPFQGPPGWQSRGGFGGGQDAGDFSDFFSSIFGSRGDAFGGGQRRPTGRKGQDVEMQLSVFLEETLSTESKQISFQVPQYDASGRHVSNTTKSLNVKIPAGVADGERIRLKGHGLLNKAGQRGYLFVQLKAVMPKTSDDEVKALWQELAKKAAFDPRENWNS